jgi:ABC-type lipoprotein export system ATPase subunit
VLITHDNAIADQAKRIVRLHDGKIVSDGASERISAKELMTQ